MGSAALLAGGAAVLDLGAPIDSGKTRYRVTVVATDLAGNALGTTPVEFAITVVDFNPSPDNPSPEPGTLWQLALGGSALALIRTVARRRLLYLVDETS